MADEDRKLTQEFRALSQSQAIDRTEDYVRRGRAFAAAAGDALKAQWVETCRQWCRDAFDAGLQRTANDIESELTLRGEEVPVELVAAEMQALSETVKAALRQLGPEQRRRMGENMQAELEAYLRHRRS